MKRLLSKILISLFIIGLIFLGVIAVLNYYVLPDYVNVPEVNVPNIVGLQREVAVKILEKKKLTPVKKGIKYTLEVPKGRVLFQKPLPNTKVKEGRRIYYWVSGGDPLVEMPKVVGKTIRDAKVTLQRLGIKISKIDEERSELPNNTVIEQSIAPGEQVAKGDSVNLTVSIGPRLGMVRVPSLVGKTLRSAKRTLRKFNLKPGKIIYQKSENLLPNTVIDQIPSEDALINVGESVDLVVTK